MQEIRIGKDLKINVSEEGFCLYKGDVDGWHMIADAGYIFESRRLGINNDMMKPEQIDGIKNATVYRIERS